MCECNSVEGKIRASGVVWGEFFIDVVMKSLGLEHIPASGLTIHAECNEPVRIEIRSYPGVIARATAQDLTDFERAVAEAIKEPTWGETVILERRVSAAALAEAGSL